MIPAPSPHKAPKPPAQLTQREEVMLRAIAKLRYATSLDIAHLPCCSSLSASYLRKLLARLSGGKDLTPNQYLCRFPRPKVTAGNPEKVYALGARGKEYLTRVLAERVAWWYGPAKMSSHSFSYLLHQLTLTRLVCAAWYWSQLQSRFTLVQALLSYELAQRPPTVPIQTDDRHTTVPVVPDAWLCFERADGEKYPILLECDRGTEYQERFTQHVTARIHLITSGVYERMFGTPAVVIAYVATGLTDTYRETRLHTMRQWTEAVLTQEISEERRQDWCGLFRFTSLAYEDIYDRAAALFAAPIWYRPDSLLPLTLLSGEHTTPHEGVPEHDDTTVSPHEARQTGA